MCVYHIITNTHLPVQATKYSRQYTFCVNHCYLMLSVNYMQVSLKTQVCHAYLSIASSAISTCYRAVNHTPFPDYLPVKAYQNTAQQSYAAWQSISMSVYPAVGKYMSDTGICSRGVFAHVFLSIFHIIMDPSQHRKAVTATCPASILSTDTKVSQGRQLNHMNVESEV